MANIWLMCWSRYSTIAGRFDPDDSGEPVMVNAAHIMTVTAAPSEGVSAVKMVNYGDLYVPGTPAQVVRALSTWSDSRRGAHIDMRDELPPVASGKES